IRGGRSVGLLRPDLDMARLMIALVEKRDNPTHAAGSRCSGPNDIRIDRIWRGESALAASHGTPGSSGKRATRWAATRSFFGRRLAFSATTATAGEAVARPAIGTAVLLVAVDEIRNLVVHGDVVELRYRKLDAIPRAAAIDRDAEAAIVGHGEAVAIVGI